MADACRVAPEQETREAASGCHPKPRGAKAYFPTSLHPGPRRLVGGGRGHGGLRDGGLHLTGALIDSGYQLAAIIGEDRGGFRSEEHTSELQSLMRISYAVFCLKKKNNTHNKQKHMNLLH